MKLTNTKALTEHLYNTLKLKFPSLNWKLYPSEEELKGQNLPIAMLELQSFELLKDITTDIKSIGCDFVLRLLFNETAKAQLNIRDGALAMSVFLESHYLSDQISAIEILSNTQDYLTPDVNGFIAWEILFRVSFICGHSIYQLNGLSPEVALSVENNTVEKWIQ